MENYQLHSKRQTKTTFRPIDMTPNSSKRHPKCSCILVLDDLLHANLGNPKKTTKEWKTSQRLYVPSHVEYPRVKLEANLAPTKTAQQGYPPKLHSPPQNFATGTFTDPIQSHPPSPGPTGPKRSDPEAHKLTLLKSI
jgi:hypothetical protein